MADSLIQIDWKLERARAQLQALNGIAQGFLGGNFYALAPDVDRQKRLVLKVASVEPFPLDYAGLVGEILHQVRSSLDHLIFALATPGTPAQEKRIGFPIATSRANFASNKVGALRGVPRGVLTRVESVQPYHRRKWPETRLLGQLQALSNWDKHRTLTVAAASLIDSRITLELVGNTRIVREQLFRGWFKPNKVLARFQPGYSEKGAEIHPQVEFAFVPVFDVRSPKGVIGESVPGTLRRIIDFVGGSVVPLFERYF